jgi:hypothetical protein
MAEILPEDIYADEQRHAGALARQLADALMDGDWSGDAAGSVASTAR